MFLLFGTIYYTIQGVLWALAVGVLLPLVAGKGLVRRRSLFTVGMVKGGFSGWDGIVKVFRKGDGFLQGA